MSTTSASRPSAFRRMLDRIGLAFREQREREARRVIRRYRHLLLPPCEAAAWNEALVNRKDKPDHASELDAHDADPGGTSLQRA